MKRVYVIANPKAGTGRAGEGLAAALLDAGLDAHIAVTEGPGDAIALARDARTSAEECVVAAGGDGTVHEVANGLLAAGPGPDVPLLGILPLGSGCDYVKTFGLPTDLVAACAVLAADGPPKEVDAGRVTVQTPKGTAVRWFVNIAEVGIGPEVTRRAARLPRRLGPAVYLVAFWLTLPRFRARGTDIAYDAPDGTHHAWTGELTNLVVPIGRVFGGGMRVAPSSDPSDGTFDVQVHTGSKVDYVRGIPKVFKGTHLPHPRIHEMKATRLEVHCRPDGLVEADGEVLGSTPAVFEVVGGALRLKV